MENSHLMSENKNNTSHDGLFGVSSDDIIDLLHQGELGNTSTGTNPPGDPEKEQIVNEQDQLDIVNPAEDETAEAVATNSDATPADTKPAEIVQREKIPGDKEISGQLTDEEIQDIKPES